MPLDRPRSARIVLLVALATLHVPCPAAERPNIVWLLSEDNSKHYLRLFDPGGAPTPRIESLAKDGLLFEHAFSNAPVCSVARTTLMTGCFAPRIGTHHHRRSVEVPLPGDLRMFPAYLRAAGYHTTNRQKKDYNAIEGDGVWDASSRRASWRDRKSGQPFFHMQSFGASHESSLHFSRESMAKDRTETRPEDVTIAPYHPDTETFHYTHARYLDRIREIDRQIGALVDELEDDGLIEDTFIFYFGDHGGVLPRSKGYLYESGLHVPLVVRVPEKWAHLVDAKRGARVSGFVSFVDFAPTCLRLAGVDAPAELDGRAFLGEGVKLSELNARDETLGHADRFDEKLDLVRSLRKGQFKYLRSYQPFNFDGLQNNYRYQMLAYAEWRSLHRAGKLSPVQRAFFERRAPEALYDLETDPHETRNVASDPAYASRLVAMRTRLASIVKSWPDLGFFPEPVLVAEASRDPTGFGAARRAEIARLVEIADASLLPLEEARPTVDSALRAMNPWERYWGWIAASSLSERSSAWDTVARKSLEEEPELLVRVRAAEYLALGLSLGSEPEVADAGLRERIVQALLVALSHARHGSEASLVLNTIVLLRDGPPHLTFPAVREHIPPACRSHDDVKRRLEYLDGN